MTIYQDLSRDMSAASCGRRSGLLVFRRPQRSSWTGSATEPTMLELLADPITRRLMHADRVSLWDLLTAVDAVATDTPALSTAGGD